METDSNKDDYIVIDCDTNDMEDKAFDEWLERNEKSELDIKEE